MQSRVLVLVLVCQILNLKRAVSVLAVVTLVGRPRPLREFSVGDEVAVWRRGTGKGAPGKQRRAQWRGPGIILGAVRGNCLVAMPGSVIKAALEQMRHRTAEEQETD